MTTELSEVSAVLGQAVRAMDESKQQRIEAAKRLKENAVEMAQVAGMWALAEKSDAPGDPAAEKAAGEVIVAFMRTTDAYRKQLLDYIGKVEDLELPGQKESKESFIQALEAADQLLESMGDTVWSDFTPLLKKHGYTVRR